MWCFSPPHLATPRSIFSTGHGLPPVHVRGCPGALSGYRREERYAERPSALARWSSAAVCPRRGRLGCQHACQSHLASQCRGRDVVIDENDERRKRRNQPTLVTRRVDDRLPRRACRHRAHPDLSSAQPGWRSVPAERAPDSRLTDRMGPGRVGHLLFGLRRQDGRGAGPGRGKRRRLHVRGGFQASASLEARCGRRDGRARDRGRFFRDGLPSVTRRSAGCVSPGAKPGPRERRFDRGLAHDGRWR